MQDNRTDNSIAQAAADKLIAAHDGDVALLYIYLRRSGCRDLERAARDLCRTMRQITEAEEKLRRMGLSPFGEDDTPTPVSGAAAPVSAGKAEDRLYDDPDELPQYRAEEIARRSREDERFRDILLEAQKVMGRPLNSNDTRSLFTIYDHLALPVEVILVLLHYCAERNQEKYHGSRRLTSRFIEKEAFEWVHREILTLEQTEEYIRSQKERRSDLGRAKEALAIRGRELTATEERYLSSWLEMGFRAEAIAIAYDRTVTQIGSLKWPYINKILQSWHENGLHTPEEIQAGDSRSSRGRSKKEAGEVAPVDMDALRRQMEKI